MIRLVVLDCDGTLVDSQHLIVHAMAGAFQASGRAPPEVALVRAVIGLSLTEAIARLEPGATPAECLDIAAGYREAWRALRETGGVTEPLFPDVKETLTELDRRGHLLGVATGKARRGLDLVLKHHGLSRLFASLQTADRHPSKPHPAMLEAAMRETGSEPDETLMVGDTSFDMAMARAAGVRAIGVAWGYHSTEALAHAGAEVVLQDFGQLLQVVSESAR